MWLFSGVFWPFHSHFNSQLSQQIEFFVSAYFYHLSILNHFFLIILKIKFLFWFVIVNKHCFIFFVYYFAFFPIPVNFCEWQGVSNERKITFIRCSIIIYKQCLSHKLTFYYEKQNLVPYEKLKMNYTSLRDSFYKYLLNSHRIVFSVFHLGPVEGLRLKEKHHKVF